MKPIHIIDGARSPFLKARNAPGPFSASDMASQVGRTLLSRQPFAPSDLSEVIIGCASPSTDEINIGRMIALRLGCGNQVTGYTVMRNCASGMQALDNAMANIETGRSDLVLAGGVDALSRAPLLFSDNMVRWLARFYSCKTLGQKLRHILRLKLRDLAPVFGLLKGLTDPIVGLTMGQTAENLAHRFGISRRQMDEYAHQSHQFVLKQRQDQTQDPQVVPLIDSKGKWYSQDDGVRADATLERLGALRPVFDKHYGQVTAGNSSQITDGAALLLLASDAALQKHHLHSMGRIIDVQWAGLSPAQMGLGPVYAATQLMQRHQLKFNDLAAWEINEAFAAQVLGCLAAWQDPEFCQTELGLNPAARQAMGEFDVSRLNQHGGAIALGHPVGASGARIVLKLLAILKPGERGIATICIGGGQGGAMLVEKT